jgi:hypothetical protein
VESCVDQQQPLHGGLMFWQHFIVGVTEGLCGPLQRRRLFSQHRWIIRLLNHPTLYDTCRSPSGNRGREDGGGRIR